MWIDLWLEKATIVNHFNAAWQADRINSRIAATMAQIHIISLCNDISTLEMIVAPDVLADKHSQWMFMHTQCALHSFSQTRRFSMEGQTAAAVCVTAEDSRCRMGSDHPLLAHSV